MESGLLQSCEVTDGTVFNDRNMFLSVYLAGKLHDKPTTKSKAIDLRCQLVTLHLDRDKPRLIAAR